METKPGYKTTEFYATLFVLIIQALNEVGLWNFTTNQQSTKWGAVVAAAYVVSRGFAKAGVKPSS